MEVTRTKRETDEDTVAGPHHYFHHGVHALHGDPFGAYACVQAVPARTLMGQHTIALQRDLVGERGDDLVAQLREERPEVARQLSAHDADVVRVVVDAGAEGVFHLQRLSSGDGEQRGRCDRGTGRTSLIASEQESRSSGALRSSSVRRGPET